MQQKFHEKYLVRVRTEFIIILSTSHMKKLLLFPFGPVPSAARQLYSRPSPVAALF